MGTKWGAVALNYQHSLDLFHSNCSSELGSLTAFSNISKTPKTDECPPWWHQVSVNGHDLCFVGPNLHGIDHYFPRMQTMLLECMCMTEEDGLLVAGACVYTCNAIHGDFPLPCHVSQLNNFTCEDLNRRGRLCGECKEGYAPPVYSYDFRCVECKEYSYNWLKYIAAAFLPLTLFFFIVTVFSISFTSPRISGVVLIYQLFANPIQLSVLTSLSDSGLLMLNKNIVSAFTSIAAVWNLEFFRDAYEPFCLHPKMTTLHTLALDYAVAFYPLLLIMLTYVLVTLHDKGFKLAKCVWGPVTRLSKKLKQSWHTRTSIIDVFASFIFLSTARLLTTSFMILVPSISISFNNTGSTCSVTYSYIVFNAPNVAYFSWKNLPFAGTAILVVVLLNLLPMVLLFIYPFRCFQKLLNRLNLNSISLRTFIEVFQGSFKNGTDNTRDYRSFSGALLLFELVLCVLFGLTRSNYFYPIASIFILIYVSTVGIFQPYRRRSDNCITVTMMAALLTTYMGMTLNIAINRATQPLLHNSGQGTDVLLMISGVLIGVGVVVPSLYLLGLVAILTWYRVIRSS